MFCCCRCRSPRQTWRLRWRASGRAIGKFAVAMIFACLAQAIPVKLYNSLQNHSVDAVYPPLWLQLFTLPLPLASLHLCVVTRANGSRGAPDRE